MPEDEVLTDHSTPDIAMASRAASKVDFFLNGEDQFRPDGIDFVLVVRERQSPHRMRVAANFPGKNQTMDLIKTALDLMEHRARPLTQVIEKDDAS